MTGNFTYTSLKRLIVQTPQCLMYNQNNVVPFVEITTIRKTSRSASTPRISFRAGSITFPAAAKMYSRPGRAYLLNIEIFRRKIGHGRYERIVELFCGMFSLSLVIHSSRSCL